MTLFDRFSKIRLTSPAKDLKEHAQENHDVLCVHSCPLLNSNFDYSLLNPTFAI